jgi:signal transduction histidine kinase
MVKGQKRDHKAPILVAHNPKKGKSDIPPKGNRIRLASFIHENTEKIVGEWEAFAQTLKPAANDMTPHALRDHIHPILAFIVKDIESTQTSSEQIQKSQGEKVKSNTPTAAETHAAVRLAGGFDIDHMVSEYRALRASVIKLWNRTNTAMDSTDINDLIRFNESIDQELAESVSMYTKKASYSKNLFIGILSHELRNPLNVIAMSAQLLLHIGVVDKRQPLNERQTLLTTQILDSTSRITEMVNIRVFDMLSLNRADSLALCAFSITKMISAHCTWSAVSGFSAS